MRSRVIWLIVFLAGCQIIAAQTRVIEEIVAIVNDEIITLSQYKQQYDSLLQMLRAQFHGEELEKQRENMKKQLLDMIINEMLLLQLAREKQLNVSEQVKLYLENIIKENHLSSEAELRQELRRQGIEYNDFVRQIEENLLKHAVIATEVDRSIVIEEAEIIRFYQEHPQEFTEPEEVILKAIFLSPREGGESVEARKKQVNEKLAARESFEEVAGELSDPPLNELKGELGTFKRGELEATLQATVDKLQPGETSNWVETKNGWYLVKLERRKASRLRELEEVRRDIEEMIFQEKRGKILEEFIRNLRERSFIKILKPDPLG